MEASIRLPELPLDLRFKVHVHNIAFRIFNRFFLSIFKVLNCSLSTFRVILSLVSSADIRPDKLSQLKSNCPLLQGKAVASPRTLQSSSVS